MRILITPDVQDWAIGGLTKAIIRHLPQYDFINLAVHPRGVGGELHRLADALQHTGGIDLWHAMYWNSANQMMTMMPELKKMPKVLSHHNHYSLEESNWEDYETVVIPTQWGYDKLTKFHGNVHKVPYGIDLGRLSFIDEYPPKEVRVGYVGRVVPHKNLAMLVKQCANVGVRVIGCGYIDKPDYWASVPKDNLDWFGEVGRGGKMPQDFKDSIYERMTVFVAYSTDEKETGTLPLLEAMARGVPVMTTNQGMARDLIKDGENGVIFTQENFEEKLKDLLAHPEKMHEMRVKAWHTIKNYTEQYMARQYAKVYHQTLYPDHKEMVSVIIPTFNRADTLVEVMASVEANTYPNKEMVICDDGSTDHTARVVAEMRKTCKTPIQYFKTGTEDEYGLARARNIGAIEAIGDILMFLDDRLALEPLAIEEAIKTILPNTWFSGVKKSGGVASTKTAFVENFSWIYRQDFIKGGMFCERMNKYGGLSQETRKRFSLQGFAFNRNQKAECNAIADSARVKKLRDVWQSKLTLNKMYGRE